MLSKAEIAKIKTIRQRYNEELDTAAQEAAYYQSKKDFSNMTKSLAVQNDRAAMVRAVDAVAFSLGVSEEVRGRSRGSSPESP